MNKKIVDVLMICVIFSMSVTSVSGFLDSSKTVVLFSSDCPDDFSMFVYCGGFNTWSPTYMLYTNATGETFYYNVTYENIIIGNFTLVSSFNFTNDEMDEIWDIIMANGFFNLKSNYERESVLDGSFANITITGNGVTNSVQTENIDMYKLDNIIKMINSLSPGDYDLFYNALINHAPVTPGRPSGSLTGNVRDEYVYTSIGFDADNDSIYFMFDWGDKTNSGWVGPYNSGENVSLSHSWNKKGDYNVRVKAIDDPNNDGNLSDGYETDWSDSLLISMPKGKQISATDFIELLKKFIDRFTFMKSFIDFIDIPIYSFDSLELNYDGFDPNSGSRGKLDEEKCEITITVDIKLYGEWVDKYSDQMGALLTVIKDDIENKWNREKWDKDNKNGPDGEPPWHVKCKDDCKEHEPGCIVKIEVKVEFCKNVNASNIPTGGQAKSNEGQGHHWIRVADPTKPEAEYVNAWDGKLPTPNDGSETTGVFNVQAFVGVFAHEAGHLMGLSDQQDTVEVDGPNGQGKVKVKVPKDGYKDNIMGWPSGWPTQADIDQIVKSSGIECPCKCCPEENDTEKPKVNITSPPNGSTVQNKISVNGIITDYGGSGVTELDYRFEWEGGSSNGNSYYIDPPVEYTEFELGPLYLDNYLDPDDDWFKITIYATDTAGNMGQDSITVHPEVEEDETPPVTVKTIGQPQEEGGYIIWPHTPITFTATDSESGVNYIYYEVWWDSNGDEIVDTLMGSEKIYEDSLTFSVNMWGVLIGIIELRWYAVDNVGNTENMHYQEHYVTP
jgi:hypothetical protein